VISFGNTKVFFFNFFLFFSCFVLNEFLFEMNSCFVFETGNDGKWANYEVKASDVVEDGKIKKSIYFSYFIILFFFFFVFILVYQGYKANRGDTDVRAVKSGDWEYQVDFLAMKQTNTQVIFFGFSFFF
jgi:hypothetical protein